MELKSLVGQGLVLPKTKMARMAIEHGHVNDATLEDCIVIRLSPGDVGALWGMGIFQRINSLCGTIISDYEEEEIPSDNLNEIAKMIDKEFIPRATCTLEFYTQFRDACRLGAQIGMPIYVNM